MILIDGKKEAANLREELKKEVSQLKTKYNKIPGLTVILIGDLTPSQIYVRNKEKSAIEVGIKSEIVKYPENLEEKTMEIAQTIASKSMHTLRIAKQTIRASLDNGITEGVEIEAIAFANLFDTEDKEIGVQSFLNRSDPKWVHK